MSLILQYGKDEDIAEVRKKEEQCLKNNEFKNGKQVTIKQFMKQKVFKFLDDVSLLVHDTTTDRPLKRPIRYVELSFILRKTVIKHTYTQ